MKKKLKKVNFIEYDATNDVLYITIREGNEGVGENLTDDIVEIRDDETHEVLGYIILFCSEVIDSNQMKKVDFKEFDIDTMMPRIREAISEHN